MPPADPNPVTSATLAGTPHSQAVTADTLTPATKPDASGALQEPEIAERVDTTHPAVDDHPREGLPPSSNQVDFNDPNLPGDVASARALGLPDDYDAPAKADKKA